MNISTFSFTPDTLSDFSNDVKDVIFSNMVKDGEITKEQAKEWSETYIVSIRKPSGLSKFFRDLFGPSLNDYRIFLTKTIPKDKGFTEITGTSKKLEFK